jgi:hypothetical protein
VPNIAYNIISGTSDGSIAGALNRNTSMAPKTTYKYLYLCYVYGMKSPACDMDTSSRHAEKSRKAARAADHRISLGRRLGRITNSVEPVGFTLISSGCLLISTIPPALSVIGPKVSIARI